jgi:hypothetical protein
MKIGAFVGPVEWLEYRAGFRTLFGFAIVPAMHSRKQNGKSSATFTSTLIYSPMKNKAAVSLGRRGGRSTSSAKQAALRENGKLGGRPPLQNYPQKSPLPEERTGTNTSTRYDLSRERMLQ